MDYPDFTAKGTPYCQKEGVDPEIFFPDPYQKGAAAINDRAVSVCMSDGGCPYKNECLAWALFAGEPGTWGGTTENQRRKIKKSASSSATG